jgi:hypothetical protein
MKKDKGDYIENLAKKAEKAAYNGNKKELSATTKKLLENITN